MEDMRLSKLDKLIKEFCPDGVEFKKIGEVVEFRAGWLFPSIEQGNLNGYYPFYKVADMNNSLMYMETANNYVSRETANKLKCKPAPKGTIIFPKVGATMVTNKKRILSKESCYDNNIMGIIAKKINSSFLFYFLSGISLMDFANGSGAVPSLDKKRFENYLIPIPPLEVQKEIVHILDSFTNITTELIENLKTELTARRKQYEYYRDKLLTFGDGVEWRELGEIGKVKMCKRILKEQTSTIGDVPFYKIGTFGKQADAYISKDLFEKYISIFPYPKKGDILISCSGTIGKSVEFDGKPSYFQDSNIVWLEHDNSKVINKYLWHYYQKKPWKISTGGTIARLYNDNILKTKIPIPPLKEQQRIVSILDRFDKLCNDLTEGLPAEISARQKQYEYYRDKLLTFKSIS
ncbi:type I restriction/modification specificity protein [Candidatus Arthromitus sp. SFB-rat-Yit]|nr:type I restriction/modification specificity protein [Candidatus Arthromitus sp. SFB-rat-Yit]